MDAPRPEVTSVRVAYDYADQDRILHELMCSICLEPFQQPRVTPCEHAFCTACVEECLRAQLCCPECREPLAPDALLSPDRTLSRLLDGLYVRCVNNPQCSWVGERATLQQHLTRSCERERVSCRKGCGALVVRCLVDHHEAQDCEVAIAERGDKESEQMEQMRRRIAELEATVRRLRAQKAHRRCLIRRTKGNGTSPSAH